MFAKVVVGVRDASHAQDAIALAGVLAPGAELHLVHAYPLDPGAWSGAEPWRRGLRANAEELLGGIAREAGIDTPTRALPDLSPARALQLVAEDLQADLIVVGSAHRGPVGRLLAGSVGRSVLAGARARSPWRRRATRSAAWAPSASRTTALPSRTQRCTMPRPSPATPARACA